MLPSTQQRYIQVVADGAGVATLGAAQLAIQTSLVLTNGTILTLGDMEDKVGLRSWNICTLIRDTKYEFNFSTSCSGIMPSNIFKI